MQAGATSWANVDLIDVGPGATAQAIRLALETCDLRVSLFPIGQARHLVEALGAGERSGQYVVLDCHGEDGNILLPEVAPEIEAREPFHGILTAEDVRSFVELSRRTVISTGCQTGNERLARAFIDRGCDSFVGPAGGPFGHAVLFAVVWIFYELTQMRSLDEAVDGLQRHDDEQAMWRLFRR